MLVGDAVTLNSSLRNSLGLKERCHTADGTFSPKLCLSCDFSVLLCFRFIAEKLSLSLLNKLPKNNVFWSCPKTVCKLHIGSYCISGTICCKFEEGA